MTKWSSQELKTKMSNRTLVSGLLASVTICCVFNTFRDTNDVEIINFILPLARQQSRNDPAEEGFLCDKTTVFSGSTVKETSCVTANTTLYRGRLLHVALSVKIKQTNSMEQSPS